MVIRRGRAVLGAQLLVGASMILAAKAVISADKEKPLMDGSLSPVLGLGSAIIVAVVNFVIKQTCTR